MDTRRFADDGRAFSETFAVGALVGITLLMTLSVGVYVLAVDVDEETTAEFEYDYDDSSGALLVRYVEGEEYPATQVLLEDGTTEATWADLAGLPANATMASGDAVQLGPNGIWGRPLTDATELRIHHVEGENRTQLSNWTS